MAEFDVRLAGFQDVSEIDKGIIKNNCLKFCERHNKKLKNIEFIELRLKEHQTEGTRKKFSIHSILGFSGTILTSKDFGWNLVKAADGSLKKLEREISRKFVGKIQGKNRINARKFNRLLE
ncbi:MAG: hypothetical protein ABH986_06750 [archaeon]